MLDRTTRALGIYLIESALTKVASSDLTKSYTQLLDELDTRFFSSDQCKTAQAVGPESEPETADNRTDIVAKLRDKLRALRKKKRSPLVSEENAPKVLQPPK